MIVPSEQKVLLRILALLARVQLSEQDASELRHLSSQVEFADVWPLVQHNAIQIMAWKKITQLGLGDVFIKSELEEYKLAGYEVDALVMRAQQRVTHATRLLRKLREQGVEVILLKGAALGASVYDDNAYKKMNDIDLLVKPDDLAKVVEVLQLAEFHSLGSIFDGREMDTSKNHHLSPYFSRDYSCVVGVHWHLCAPYAMWAPDIADIWRCSETMFYENVMVKRMAWEHNLAHLCMHLPLFKLGTREIADVFNLITFTDIDWTRVQDVAMQWNIETSCYRVLSLANAYEPNLVPRKVLLDLKRNADEWTITDTERRINDPFRLIRSRSVHLGKIEKAFGMFRISKNYSHRLQAIVYMWFNTLFPPYHEALRLLAASQNETLRQRRFAIKVNARQRAGRLLLKAMARDYGTVVLFYITAANVVAILKDTLLLKFLWQSQDHQTQEYLILKGLLE